MDVNRTGWNHRQNNVVTSTVELKTPEPGVTRTEQIKTGYSNVNDYSRYLQGKYSYMNGGTVSMEGIPTTVSVSGAFLRKCMNDPEKAKYLEENLAALPDCAKRAVSGCQGTLTSLSYQIDANGNISAAMSGTSDPDGKIARENAKRKAKEKKAAEEKAAGRREEKRTAEKKAAKKRAERKERLEKAADGKGTETFKVSALGADVKSATESLIGLSSGVSASAKGSFDIKA